MGRGICQGLGCRAAFAAALLVFAAACQPEEPPACPGQIQDIDTQECVPEHCGANAWGLLERTGETIHVAPWGDDGWDGSAEWPYRTIQQGADEAGDAGGGLVAVAAGTYVENLALDGDHDGVEIVGRCLELVVIDGSGAEEPGVLIAGGEVGLRGLTVTGGQIGVRVQRSGFAGLAEVDLEDVTLVRNAKAGLMLIGAGSATYMVRCEIMETQPAGDGSPGRGIEVTWGASLVARGLRLEGNHDAGLIAFDAGTTVDLEDTVIRDTQPLPGGTGGRGIVVQFGPTLVVRGLLLQGNHSVGLAAGHSGTTVDLVDTVIRDTQPLPDGTLGRGVVVQDGASLSATDLLLEGNHAVGLFAALAGTAVHLEDATIRDTQPLPDGAGGRGIEMQGGASLVARGLLLEGSHGGGLWAGDVGTSVDLEDATIRDTQPLREGTRGWGIMVLGGASLVATGLLLDGNHEVGLLAEHSATTVDLEDATIRDTQPLPLGTFGSGIEMQGGASLVARDLLLEGNSAVGLSARDAGTRVDLQNARITGTRPVSNLAAGFGIGVHQGASVTGVGLQVEDNEGPGIYVVEGGVFEGWGVALHRNTFAAAVVKHSHLALHGGTVSGSTVHPSEGGPVGVFAWDIIGPPDIELDGVSFSDLPGPALYLRGPGRYVMRGCSVQDTGTWPLSGGVFAVEGVQPWHELGITGYFTGLLLEGSTFSDLRSDAILLDSSSATLDLHPETSAPNTFGDLDGAPIVWQRCTDVATPEILDGSSSDPACEPTPRTLGPLLEYQLWLAEVDPLE